MAETDTVPVTVVIPTAGRERLLQRCLESLASCDPRAAEIVVVDQSARAAVADVVDSFEAVGARLVLCQGTGVARGRNDGLRSAVHDLALVTDDDCTVQADWVAEAWRLASLHPGAIVTGRVLPVGDPAAVPSTKVDPLPHDFTGEAHGGALFPNNVVLPRSAVLALGGFDERFGPREAAEDNDFCYRWLKEGRRLVYDPSLTVSHHDWRSPVELEQLYVRYARGQGFLYAKHLRRGDLRMLRWLGRDLVWALRGLASRVVKGRAAWTDPRRGIPRGLPGGFAHGWRVYRRPR